MFSPVAIAIGSVIVIVALVVVLLLCQDCWDSPNDNRQDVEFGHINTIANPYTGSPVKTSQRTLEGRSNPVYLNDLGEEDMRAVVIGNPAVVDQPAVLTVSGQIEPHGEVRRPPPGAHGSGARRPLSGQQRWTYDKTGVVLQNNNFSQRY